MEPTSPLEKTGKSVSQNYENLVDCYQPALRKMVTAAADIDQCLFELARAQNVYLKVNLSISFDKMDETTRQKNN